MHTNQFKCIKIDQFNQLASNNQLESTITLNELELT